MFKFPSLFARLAPEHSASARDSLRFHAPIYCAARNVYLTAETVFTTLDADRLFCALSELHRLATALESPAQDLAEIATWRDAVGVHAEQLRASARDERKPDVTPLDVFISKGVIEREKRQRRAS